MNKSKYKDLFNEKHLNKLNFWFADPQERLEECLAKQCDLYGDDKFISNYKNILLTPLFCYNFYECVRCNPVYGAPSNNITGSFESSQLVTLIVSQAHGHSIDCGVSGILIDTEKKDQDIRSIIGKPDISRRKSAFIIEGDFIKSDSIMYQIRILEKYYDIYSFGIIVLIDHQENNAREEIEKTTGLTVCTITTKERLLRRKKDLMKKSFRKKINKDNCIVMAG